MGLLGAKCPAFLRHGESGKCFNCEAETATCCPVSGSWCFGVHRDAAGAPMGAAPSGSTGGKSCQPHPWPAGIHWGMLNKIRRAAPASTARWQSHAPRRGAECPSGSSGPSPGEFPSPWHCSPLQGWARGMAVLSRHERHVLEAWSLTLPGACETSVQWHLLALLQHHGCPPCPSPGGQPR